MDFSKYNVNPQTTEAKFLALKIISDKALADSAWTQLSDAPLSDADKLLWQTYRESLMVVEFSNANPDLIEFPNPPVFVNGQPPAEVTAYRASRADLKAQADVMLVRLQAIQTAVNPTNAQVVAAIRDLALYMEKLTRVIRRIV